jgi:hypothetical protein
MEKLEEHIRMNREDLDRYSPASAIWKRIKRELEPKKTSSYHWRSIAAMLVVVLGTAMIFFIAGNKGSAKKMEISSDADLSPSNRQLKETEIYYNNLINSLYRDATPLLTGNPEVEKELVSDISQLDSICTDIKKDLKDNVANQEVVEALIQNYRIKIRLLEDMLSVLKEENNDPAKSKNHEL